MLLASARLPLYFRLVRLDRPIGILLLLWPTLAALWMAADGWPPLHLVVIFTLGTVLMRSAGCAINDYFDRDFDRHVERTAQRVLTTGLITPKEALAVAAILAFVAALLVLPLNYLTWGLACIALLLAGTYPLFKRFFGVPQAYLGLAYGFGIPMAFAAVQHTVPPVAWVMLLANVAWSIAYDTEYAMVDREDDIKLGLKASAVTFGRWDVAMVGVFYAVTLALFFVVGRMLSFTWFFNTGLVVAAGIAVLHLYWIRHRERGPCFRAFLHNRWLGLAIFIGTVLETVTR